MKELECFREIQDLMDRLDFFERSTSFYSLKAEERFLIHYMHGKILELHERNKELEKELEILRPVVIH